MRTTRSNTRDYGLPNRVVSSMMDPVLENDQELEAAADISAKDKQDASDATTADLKALSDRVEELEVTTLGQEQRALKVVRNLLMYRILGSRKRWAVMTAAVYWIITRGSMCIGIIAIIGVFQQCKQIDEQKEANRLLHTQNKHIAAQHKLELVREFNETRSRLMRTIYDRGPCPEGMSEPLLGKTRNLDVPRHGCPRASIEARSFAVVALADLERRARRNDVTKDMLLAERTDLSDAVLIGADFGIDAKLRRIYFRNANLSYADLKGANFDDTILDGAILDSAYLKGADLSRARISAESTFTDALYCGAGTTYETRWPDNDIPSNAIRLPDKECQR